MDDLKIIESCLLGNTQMFSRLIDNYKSMIYNLAYRMSNNPEQIVSQKENLRAIQQAIYSLPLKYREVIVLRHLQDLSYIEISNILKLPQGTVKVRLYRAREQLRKILA